MRDLRRSPDVERLPGLIPFGQQAARLDRDRGLPADHDVKLDHMRRIAKRRRHVAERRGHHGHLVWQPMEQLRRTGSAGRPRVAYRRELGVVDGDEVGSILGLIRIVGHHDRHRLTHVADPALGQHRLQVGQQVTRIWADPYGNRRQDDVGGGQDCPDAVQRQRA